MYLSILHQIDNNKKFFLNSKNSVFDKITRTTPRSLININDKFFSNFLYKIDFNSTETKFPNARLLIQYEAHCIHISYF